MIKVLRRPVESALRARVGVVQQPGRRELHIRAPTSEQRLLERGEHQRRGLRRHDPPPQDPAGEHIGDEADVAEPSRGPHIGEVRDPPLIRTRRPRPPPLDVIRMPGSFRVSCCGYRGALAAPDPADPEESHQAFDLITADSTPRSACGFPELPPPVEAPVAYPEIEQLVCEVRI